MKKAPAVELTQNNFKNLGWEVNNEIRIELMLCKTRSSKRNACSIKSNFMGSPRKGAFTYVFGGCKIIS